MTTFKQWIHSTYDRQELQDIAQHGCQSGIASGLIYYSETCAKYEENKEELHAVIGQYEEETGQFPEYIIQYLGDLVSFQNAVVWFVAKLYAEEMTADELTE